MRQTASEGLCSSAYPKFAAERVDELGPNHCQRTETSAWSRNRLGNKAEGITIVPAVAIVEKPAETLAAVEPSRVGTALQPVGFTARRELRGSLLKKGFVAKG